MFLDACRNEAAERVPVWFMRQAGRSLPEYRSLREKHSILEMCRHPELAAEVTMQPVRRHGVDAAILFSDIVVPLQAMGVDLDIKPGVGPVIEGPIRTAADVARLRPLDAGDGVPFVLETIRILGAELRVPLIGFAGAPFTLASYLVEGGPSKNHARTKAFMLGEPDTWCALMEALSDAVLLYLRAQVGAGASAVQLFDSWVGAVAPNDYERHVMPWVTKIFDGLEDLDVPRIHFGVGTGELLGLMSQAGADVVGVDWRVPLGEAWSRVGEDKAVQGNLDPAVCLAPWPVVEAETRRILADVGGRPGHIFNLGHGIVPETPIEHVAELVRLVKGA